MPKPQKPFCNNKKSTSPDQVLERDTMLSSRSIHDRSYLSPANTIAPMYILYTQHTHLDYITNSFLNQKRQLLTSNTHHAHNIKLSLHHVHLSCMGDVWPIIQLGAVRPHVSTAISTVRRRWGPAYMARTPPPPIGHVSCVYHFALNQ
jgi:hypothetical protein